MKNFLQFIIPILIIGVIGFVMFWQSEPEEINRKLYVKCNSKADSYQAYSGMNFKFSEKDADCALDIKIINVDIAYIKINTGYLWTTDDTGKIDDSEPREDNIIEVDKEVSLYSYDKKTKFVFEYK